LATQEIYLVWKEEKKKLNIIFDDIFFPCNWMFILWIKRRGRDRRVV
jgi:hypothetical protein